MTTNSSCDVAKELGSATLGGQSITEPLRSGESIPPRSNPSESNTPWAEPST
eukprot:CAMPEP_0115158690 /NCGR_PEP_ID=MMETSP0227-20121206/69746_1 /TAXON_ID=89957 /ORGANISM="Polarella glacialis, Strain CCMP 1383" /LENGTH=51 /DNA_ID=CAMNT_0002570217 /DNA_START=8 /DNA_END=159 /DNA_ORIENTATION=+